jgi:alkyldihydroxyacetonephosphate synthase
MTIKREQLRWNGWGWIDAPDLLGEKAAQIWPWMGRTFGVDPLPYTPAKPLSEITLPPSRLDAGALAALQTRVAADRVLTGDFERAYHARGRSYHDLLWLRAGRLDTVPDAVVYPVSEEETLAMVQWAADSGVALVPFGGGSSVVGGVTAAPGPGQAAVVSLDMTRMNRLLAVDAEALVARAEAGIYGPHLEEQLQAQGYTLGHYPQSFEFSTLGGWIASRGAGHQSNKYGKAEHWLASARLATPRGMWTTEGFPGSAAGPQLRDLVAGSEGALGVITEAEFRVHPVPEVTDYRGYVFPAFELGVAAARALMQAGVPTAMIRLSDMPETFFYNALDTGGAGADEPVQFCLMLVGLEGNEALVTAARQQSREIIKDHGGIHMGEGLAENWRGKRFLTPYLRDPMMDRGLGVDTLETATRWSNLLPLHARVSAALAEVIAANPGVPGARGIVMAHLSHCYHDGASLYFTYALVRDPERPVEQWYAIKRAASEAILAAGGTISHHHGVGEDHLPWMPHEKGPIGQSLLRTLKQQMDPQGVLNPGKLIAP